MSKKHFIALAAEIAKIENLDARNAAASVVSNVAQSDNPRFDRGRFFAACGL